MCVYVCICVVCVYVVVYMCVVCMVHIVCMHNMCTTRQILVTSWGEPEACRLTI